MSDQATATIDAPTADEQNPAELEAIAAALSAGEAIQDLPIAEVAPDPENAKSRLNPDPEFVESMKIRQLSAGVVVRLAVWIDQGNDPMALYLARAEAEGINIEPAADDAEATQKLAEAIEKAKAEIKYVINFGHRRWAGAKAAGRETYRAVVTEHIKDRVTKRIDRIMENVHRADLTPLEEAHEYQRLIKEDGLSQRELTRRTGIPQSIISRRVALLKLPKQAQAALDAKEITVEVANMLITFANEPKRVQRVLDVISKMPNNTDEEKEARTRAAKDEAQVEARAAEAAKAQTKKRAELKKRGIPLIEDMTAYFEARPLHRYKYQILGNANVEKAIENGTVIAWVGNGGNVEWYTTEEPQEPTAKPAEETATAEEPTEAPTTGDAPSETPTTGDAAPSEAAEAGAPAPAARKTPQEPQETDAQREAREAREREEHEIQTATMAREVACLRIAAKVPNRDQLTARLARRLLLGENVEDFEAQKLTIEWLRAAGVIPDEATVYNLFGDKDDNDPKVAARAAYVFDLSIDEMRTRDSVVFDSADARHVERLTKEAGYEPTPWEQAQMDALITD